MMDSFLLRVVLRRKICTMCLLVVENYLDSQGS